MHILRNVNDIAICKFDKKDVVRHKLVQDIVNAYQKYEEDRTMDAVKVVISNDQKAVKIPTGIRMLIRRCCQCRLELENFEGSVRSECSLC